MDGCMFAVYMLLLRQCDWETGVWFGTSWRFLEFLQGSWSLHAVQNALVRLEERGYIRRFLIKGKRGPYRILIDKYEPRFGAQKGNRLNAPESKDWNDLAWYDCTEIGTDTVCESGTETAPLPEVTRSTQKSQDFDLPASSSSFSVPVAGTRMAPKFNPKESSKNADPTPPSLSSGAARNLTDIFADKTKHWKFKQPTSRAECTAAFSKLLEENTEEEIAEVIDYAAAHPMYATGIRTVSKLADPWDWFVKRYHEIHAHMLDDADHIQRVVASVAKKKEAIKDGVASLQGATAADPLWHIKTIDGEESKTLARAPKTKAERIELIAMVKSNPRRYGKYVAYLAQKNCPKCKGADINCECVSKEDVL